MRRKLNKIVKLINENEEVILGGFYLILLAIMEGLSLMTAVFERRYIPLSIFTYIWVWMLTECFSQKYFFKKIDEILLRKPQVSNKTFAITAVVTILLSWKCFIAFLICIPQAMILGEYSRMKQERRV